MSDPKGKLFSAHDASSKRAYQQLLDSIEAVPVRTLKPRDIKGGVYLINFHESTSLCFLTRLPANLMRTIISYNTMQELVALSSCSLSLSKYLQDKYISFGGELSQIGLYPGNTYVYQDQLDLLRIYNLKEGNRIMKTYASIRPEFTGIFHINPKRETFFSYFEGSILEGVFIRYNDTMEIRRSRPCIPNVLISEVCGEIIVSASAVEIALSFPTLELKTSHWSEEEAPLALKFIGEKRMVLVQKSYTFEVYSTSMMLVNTFRHEGNLRQLEVPDPAMFVFAACFPCSISGYNIKTGRIQQHFQWKRKGMGSNPVEFQMYRLQRGSVSHDFLFLLLTDGQVLVNNKELTAPRHSALHLKVAQERLFIWTPSTVEIFAYSETAQTYTLAQVLHVDIRPEYTEYWKMKCLCVHRNRGSIDISWYFRDSNALRTFYHSTLPDLGNLSVQTFNQQTLVKGTIPIATSEEDLMIPCVYVFNFNLNSSLRHFPDLTEDANLEVKKKMDEKLLQQIRRRELKALEQEGKRKRAEEEERKHQPKGHK